MKTCIKCGNIRIKGKAYCHKCRPPRSGGSGHREEPEYNPVTGEILPPGTTRHHVTGKPIKKD